MHLVAVVVILIIWAGYGIKEMFTPRMPPIENVEEHAKIISQMNSVEERRCYLNQLAREKNKE